MNAIIDTSSLLALVRNYLPFDQNNKLRDWLQKSFENREFIIIDRVYDESRDIQKGVILQTLDFIPTTSRKTLPKYIVNTNDILPKGHFFKGLENEFCNQDVRRRTKISPAEFEVQKAEYLDGADAKMILYAQHIIQTNPILPAKVVIVTEESAFSNDGKYFKKIPAICKLINIDCCTLPVFFKEHHRLNLGGLLS